MGVQFFGGKFFKCVNDNGERVAVNVCICGVRVFFESNFVLKKKKICKMCTDRQQPQRLHAPQLHLAEFEDIVRQRGHSLFGFVSSGKFMVSRVVFLIRN